MIQLGFKITRAAYPSRAQMTGIVVQKVRDDGRSGPVVGDEAILWDALQEMAAERDELRRQVGELQHQLETRKGKK